MKKVIAAGHICIDITPVFPGKKQKNIADILQPGKLINMGEADVHTGGSVANTGLAMKILGADVSLMGKVGTDEFGGVICSILDRYGAADGMLQVEGESSSYSVVLAVPGIDRIFLHNPGANNTFCAKDIPRAVLEDAALFHFGYPPLMRSMYKNTGEGLLAVMKKAKAAGCVTSMDLAAVDPNSEASREDWREVLTRVLPFVDIFVPSIEEICFMLDRPRFEEWQKRAAGGDITEMLDVDKDIRSLAGQCMALGSRILLLKCGALGMYFRSASRESLIPLQESRLQLDPTVWAEKDIFEKSYLPDRILSGTGCGDTSIAAFLTAMLNGEKAETCLQLAAATGASCITAYDALSGLKPLDQLKARIAGGWPKMHSELGIPKV